MLTAVLVLVCFTSLGLIMWVSTRGNWQMTEEELAEWNWQPKNVPFTSDYL